MYLCISFERFLDEINVSSDIIREGIVLVGAGGEYEVSGCVETQASHWTIVHPQQVPAVTRGNIPHPDCVVVGARDDDVLLHVVDHSANLLRGAVKIEKKKKVWNFPSEVWTPPSP